MKNNLSLLPLLLMVATAAAAQNCRQF